MASNPKNKKNIAIRLSQLNDAVFKAKVLAFYNSFVSVYGAEKDQALIIKEVCKEFDIKQDYFYKVRFEAETEAAEKKKAEAEELRSRLYGRIETALTGLDVQANISTDNKIGALKALAEIALKFADHCGLSESQQLDNELKKIKISERHLNYQAKAAGVEKIKAETKVIEMASSNYNQDTTWSILPTIISKNEPKDE